MFSIHNKAILVALMFAGVCVAQCPIEPPANPTDGSIYIFGECVDAKIEKVRVVRGNNENELFTVITVLKRTDPNIGCVVFINNSENKDMLAAVLSAKANDASVTVWYAYNSPINVYYNDYYAGSNHASLTRNQLKQIALK